MRSERVIVRAYGNSPVVCRIWDEDVRGFYVTNDEQYELLMAGKEAIPPIGIPKEDVFKYDTSLKNCTKNGVCDWGNLTLMKL